jgi:Kyakuja-Dileera-Zisupton transposase
MSESNISTVLLHPLTRLSSGADIHVSIDGNFNHRHTRAAGDCPEFHQSRHLLSKEEVDRIGAHIEKARTAAKPVKKKRNVQSLDEAINACEEAHESGSGSKIKTNLDKFDHGGVMGMTCRHDRPLFMANIDTPGEQQKYGVALIEHLFKHLPSHATVMVAYDVGCVSDRSRQLVSHR